MRANFALMERALQDIPRQLPAPPKAVLVVSGHWEEPKFTVSTAANPGMVYDYYGFPPETYQIRYPAPGSPAVAARTSELLTKAGWDVALDGERGFDHGTFSMMQPIYPEAQVPVVQLALRDNLDPAEHYEAGVALAPLRDEGVLIIGSGQSYHNLRRWNASGAVAASVFDQWLRKTVLGTTPAQLRDGLLRWKQAPAARESHPREEHLIPLMVAAGAAGGDPATGIYGEMFMGSLAVSSFRFGADTTPTSFDQLAKDAAAA